MVLSEHGRKDQATSAEARRRGSGLCISHALLLLCALLGPGRAVAQAPHNGSVFHGLVWQMDRQIDLRCLLVDASSLRVARAWPALEMQASAFPELRFFQGWWARMLAILLLAILVGILLRLRLQQRMQHVRGSMGIVLEERNRIAQECHDTLMAGFSAISWQLEATMNLFRDSEEAQSPAAKSCELARSMVLLCQAEARRIIYDLRETEEVTSSLSKALRRMLEENHHGEKCALHFEMEGEEVSLPPGSVHHLARIGQEALRNALRHAVAESIHIRLVYETDALRLLIRDDGRGFHLDEAAARTGHFGIAVMQERARKVGGALRLHSDDFGTEVEVTVPFDGIYLTRNSNRNIKEKEVVQWIGL
jgi:signal transduction histidine kinase